MIQGNRHTQEGNSNTTPKWFNSPVTIHEGTLDDIRAHIPDFERRSFGLTQPGNEQTRLNERLDTRVRLPFRDDKTFVPVGVVSKEYTLVPHTTVLGIAVKALDSINVSPSDVKAEITISEYGERMALSLYLPKKYDYDPGDGNQMALRLECVNSVDGSTRFRAFMGWFRFVCSNGLIIGVTRSDFCLRHVGDIRLEDVGAIVEYGLKESEAEKRNFEVWRKAEITLDKLAPWVDKDLREQWGFKAAARTFHIAQTGFDADVVGQYKGNTPTSIAVRKTKCVPGTPPRCRNLFDLGQILAWLAKERRDVQEQMELRMKIPGLMKPLID